MTSPGNAMANEPTPTRPPSGLRERKKARTRATIQREALRLFRERGYEATTIELIAQAAEVAHTTVFRYFPTKEDLVLSDEYDPMFFEALRAQPPELEPVQALRAALRGTFSHLSAQDLAAARERTVLTLSVPALRGALLDNLVQTMQAVTALIAARTGRAPDDTAVRTLAAAVFGIVLDLMLRWAEDPELDIPQAADDALAALQQGLSLHD